MDVGASFGWPFRGRWIQRWLIGIVAALLLPVGFVLLLGYGVASVRGSARDEDPPGWSKPGRLIVDGLAVAFTIAVITAPFAIIAFALVPVLANPDLWRSADPLLHVEAWTTAIFIVALPCGIALLLLMPHATARFARSGRLVHLLDFPASLRSVRTDFKAWNLAIAAIVTAWAIGLACSALFCVGLAPGMFYAILVSAHATAALHPEGANPSAR